MSSGLLRSAPLGPLAQALREGTPDDLTVYLTDLCDRIEAVDPHIHALLPEPDRRARLLREAKDLAARYPDPARRPPLFGVPVGVKDIFRADGFPTRAGSELPESEFAGPEAPSVTRLWEAGALILGKTVTTEFAYFEPGPTRNPHDPAHTPGGSSSGSAAAVAAALGPLALGTQTSGSVIRPAAFCGVVGFKPTYGRVTVENVIPFAPSLDTCGLFAQDMAGMALAASVLCPDWRPCPLDAAPIRLGIPEGPYLAQASPDAIAAFGGQVARLAEAGFEIARVPVMADIEAVNRRHNRLMAVELARTHADWFGRYEALYRPRTAALIREGQTIGDAEWQAARDGRLALRGGLERQMTAHDVDAWICPAATGPAPEGLESTGDPRMNLPWTHTGFPAVTVPVGRAANGLPLGLQCVAKAGEDERLIALAVRVEQAFRAAP